MLDLVASGKGVGGEETTRMVKTIMFIPAYKCTMSFFKNKRKVGALVKFAAHTCKPKLLLKESHFGVYTQHH